MERSCKQLKCNYLKNQDSFIIELVESTSNFQHFGEKDEPQSFNNSEVTDSEKAWLLKCLKDCASGHPSAGVNVLMRPKHC